MNFSVRDYSYRYHCNGFTITVTTDIPCHLWMRWSLVPPQVHSQPVLRRGLRMHDDVYLCFVAYHDNEQEEAGDTLIHTFVKRPWPICDRRYFHFWGTIAGVVAKSTTAVFNLHFNITRLTIPGTSANRAIQATSVNWDTVHDAAAGAVLANYVAPWYIIVAGSSLTASYWIQRAFLFFDTSGLPPGTTIADAYLSIYVTAMWREFVANPHIYITEGVQDDPIIPTNYGDQLPYTTVGGEADLASLTPGAYRQIPFTNAGLPFITLGGITKLCLRSEIDVLDIPVLPVYNNFIFFSSQQKGTTVVPFLTICIPPS